jgi:phosphoribosylaminoimidazole-succinocarboxamide synthase
MRLFWTNYASGVDFADVKDALEVFDKVVDSPFSQKLGLLNKISSVAMQFTSKLTPFGILFAEALKQTLDVSV